ncbi:hypothetical protein [Pseudovibrio sp. SCP19]|uniref:hypothetical protein n=1 Tax=Pseudovibrio sp. SCP19 TaxID=3141374 RepID=UPI00333D137D
MNETSSLEEMFQQLMRESWAEHGVEFSSKTRLGVNVSEGIEHSIKRNAAKKLQYFDFWLAILDEHISWFVSLFTVITSEKRENKKANDFERATLAITSKIVSDSLALRHLSTLGFDNASRPILRSLCEYLEVFVAILHQPSFADEFVKSETPESAKTFWAEHLRGGKIRKKVTRAWEDFCGEQNSETATTFANWGRSSTPILSGTAHPSFVGAVFSAIPLDSHNGKDDLPGTFGLKADASVDTISIFLTFAFPVLLLSHDFPFSGFKGHIERSFDENDELHKHIRYGRGVLTNLIMSINQPDTYDYLRPCFDLSIWPEK